MKKKLFAVGDSAVAMWAALASIAMVAAAAPLPPSDNLVGYTYSVNRPVTEKTPGSLCDGDSSSGLYWHTKTVARTEIVCELSETSDIDRIEIFAPNGRGGTSSRNCRSPSTMASAALATLSSCRVSRLRPKVRRIAMQAARTMCSPQGRWAGPRGSR